MNELILTDFSKLIRNSPTATVKKFRAAITTAYNNKKIRSKANGFERRLFK